MAYVALTDAECAEGAPLRTSTMTKIKNNFDALASTAADPLGLVPVGGVVATFPHLTGAYTCTSYASSGADAYGYVLCSGTSGQRTVTTGQGITAGQIVPLINNGVFLMGSTSTSGTSGGVNSMTKTISVSGYISDHYHTLDSNGGGQLWRHQNGVVGTDSSMNWWNGPTKGGSTTGYLLDMVGNTWPLSTWSNATLPNAQALPLTGRTAAITSATVSMGSTGSNTWDNRPAYLTCVYVMRIK